MFDSSRSASQRAIFDDDTDDDAETDPFLRQSNIASIDSHPAASSTTSHNIAALPSPSAFQQQDAISQPPLYETPVRSSPPNRRSSYDSPANDPWSTTPRSNGVIPVAVPNFPRRQSNIAPTTPGETASYLLDADHINIQKSDEKEGIVGFKHVNYTLASARRGTQVVRRYSDFAWYIYSSRW